MDELETFIARFEGLRLTSYLCPAGVWTIGYGATGPTIGPHLTWTLEQAQANFRSNLAIFIAGVRRACPLTNKYPAHLTAFTSFAYNLGLTRLLSSGARSFYNRGDVEGACRNLRLWVRGGGRILPGLVLRREAECRLLTSGVHNVS